MPVSPSGAQRASAIAPSGWPPWPHWPPCWRWAATTHPQVAEAAGRKVVIVVGPVGSQTSNYITTAKTLAAQARSYGATVYEIYSPQRDVVAGRAVAQGANIFIYLGHGNG